MSAIVHYEVYVYQTNAWDLLGRYPSEKRTEALEYAKRIEHSEKKPTKVVKETYDLDTQTFAEAMVYLSEIQKPQPYKSSPYENAVIPMTKITDSDKKKSGLAEGITMLFLATAFSMIAAGVLTAMSLRGMSYAGVMPEDLASTHFVLGMFTFFFLAFSIPTASKWVDWNALLGVPDEIRESDSKYSREPDYSRNKLYEMNRTSSVSHTYPVLNKFAQSIYDFIDRLTGKKPLHESQEEAERAMEKKAAELELLEQKRQEQEEEEFKKQTENQELEEKAEEEVAAPPPPPEAVLQASETEEQEEEEETASIVIPPELEKDYMKLTTFLSLILRVLQDKNILLNTYARFGIELFLAGASEQLCKTRMLSKQQNRLLLSGLLEILGRSPTLADLFYDKIDEYVLEPKYLPVIENGGKSMEIYMNNSSSPEMISLIQATMNKWITPNKKEMSASGIYTIMFTDIVSSTHMTQTLGDRLAQQLIHRHNTIVRQALSTCGGDEIKQTGDGIMASFAWASNAIDAAIAIQKSVRLYNRQSPTVPLEIRIGLNAGEPIVENNDLFGLTVQIASRICGEAGKDQIYVSSVVKELAIGKNYSFKPLGNFTLKGISEPQALYEVLWQSRNKEKPAQKPQEEKPDEPQEVELSAVLPEF